MSRSLIFIVLIIALLSLQACQAEAPPPPTPTFTLEPTATATTEPTPTVTPTPESAVTPVLDQEALKEEWSPAITGGTVIYALCPMIVDTAVRYQSGELDESEAFGEIFAEALFLQALSEAFDVWEPDPDGEIHKSTLELHLWVLQDVMGRWMNEEITAADVPGLLEDECAAVYGTLVAIGQAASADGLSDESLNEIIAEIQQMLEAMVEELGEIDEEN
jgi:hypothetical protein